MKTKASLLQMFEDYQIQFPAEAESVRLFRHFLHTNEDGQLYDRKNFIGHITASAFVLNDSLNAVLLIKHKKLNRWLQPGGHVDEADHSIYDAAIRETQEETGIAAAHLTLIDLPIIAEVFDIDSHDIPANINKNEPAHVHHDLRFLFKCLQPGTINLNAAEAEGFKWVALSDLLTDPTFAYVARKILQVA